MERGYLSQKGRRVGRDVKEKHDSMVVETVKVGEHGNVASGSISTTRTLTNVNAGLEVLPYLSGKKLNIRTLYTPGANGIDVVVLVESIRAISERFANTAYEFFLGKRVAYLVVANYLVEGSENVEENVEESPEVEKIADISQPVNVIEEEEESAEEDYELKKRDKGNEVEESRNTPSPTTTRSLRTHSTLISLNIEKLQELTETDTIPSSSTPSSSSSKLFATNRLLSLFKSKPRCFKRYKSFFDELQGKYGYLFGHLTTRFMPGRKFNEFTRHLQDIMMESLPKMVDEHIKKILQTQVPLHVARGIILEIEKSQEEVAKMIANAIQQERENFLSEISSQVNDAITNHIPSHVDSSVRSYMSGHVLPSTARPRDQDDPHKDAHPEGENSAKRQKTTEHETFELGGSSSGQDYESEPGPSTSGNQEQSDDFDFWTNSYAIDDDVIPNEKVLQELVDEILKTVDEAKLRKVVDEMLR
ncbi:hypothetical protein Tco_0840944 [Tanacetum coccineum]|uniref:Uncharacterized protein n=1 Tax=Tanacetum coccineum TaxID=301880 RepID=A0ABQ5AXA8_9ASTR